MGNDWFQSGFDVLDDEDKWTKPQFSDSGPGRLWIPPGETKRVMLLDDIPFQFWEHNWRTKENGFRNWTICLKRNGIEEMCSICDDTDWWAYYIGFLTAIDFSKWEFTDDEGKKRTAQYIRRLFAAKAGSKKNPGILHRLRKLKERRGSLVGTIWDVERTGDRSPSCGDVFDFVERVEPDAIEQYAKTECGITDEQWEKSPWEPFDYQEIFKPMSLSAMKRLVDNMDSKGRKDSGKGKPSGGNDESPEDHDPEKDIPF